MNNKAKVVNKFSYEFESWNIEDESSKHIKINIPHETKEFINLLQINKGHVHKQDNEIINISDSLDELSLDELQDSIIQEISEEDKSYNSKSSDNNEFNKILFASCFQQHKEWVRRSQMHWNLFKSNLCEKHSKDKPSIEILSKIMMPNLKSSYP